MFDPPLDLASARILVTNDDGIAAPGLKILERVALGFTKDVWVVAPEREQSGAGHSLTLHTPLRIRQVSRRRYAVEGTPTDCVLLGIEEIVKQRKPDLVLSGINPGGNMAEDVTYSGTVAAAMEGTLMDVPSIAISLAVSHGVTPVWATAAHWAEAVVRRLATLAWPRNTLMNVNIPNRPLDEVSGIEASIQGRRKLGSNLVSGFDPRNRPYVWIGPQTRNEDDAEEGSDIRLVARGAVSVTPVNLDLTHLDGLAVLRRALG